MSAESLTTQPEIELLPAAASPLATVGQAEMMHRRFGLAAPVSGNQTARMHLDYFRRTAALMVAATESRKAA